jgi:hypothetical protein
MRTCAWCATSTRSTPGDTTTPGASSSPPHAPAAAAIAKLEVLAPPLAADQAATRQRE